VAQEDWRIRIEVEEDEHASRLLDRLGLDLDLGSEARELVKELEEHRLVVSRDGNEIFVYASSLTEAERARAVIEAELRETGIAARASTIEHWLAHEERWDDEPSGETWETDELERGYAPWEVRIEFASHRQAADLADRLEQQGYSVVRRWRYVIVGTAAEADARALAQALHGEVQLGGDAVWEAVPGNPFAVFGGLGGT
jgi:hypothetical protein